MDWAKITANGVNRQVAGYGGKRFTGSDKVIVMPVR
jgi:hypothetical protein